MSQPKTIPVYEGPNDGDGPWAYLTLEVFPAETVLSGIDLAELEKESQL